MHNKARRIARQKTHKRVYMNPQKKTQMTVAMA